MNTVLLVLGVLSSQAQSAFDGAVLQISFSSTKHELHWVETSYQREGTGGRLRFVHKEWKKGILDVWEEQRLLISDYKHIKYATLEEWARHDELIRDLGLRGFIGVRLVQDDLFAIAIRGGDLFVLQANVEAQSSRKYLLKKTLKLGDGDVRMADVSNKCSVTVWAQQTKDGNSKITWDKNAGSCSKSFPKDVMSLAVSVQGRYIAVLLRDENDEVVVIDSHNGEILFRTHFVFNAVRQIAADQDEDQFVILTSLEGGNPLLLALQKSWKVVEFKKPGSVTRL